MKCRICGNENPDGAKYCGICGSQLEEEKPIVVEENNAEHVNASIYAPSVDNLGQVSMILGIVSAASSITCCLFIVAILTGIVAIILGIISLSRNKNHNGKAVAGIICGCVGLLIGVIVLMGLVEYLSNPDYYNQIINNNSNNGNLYFKLFIR